MAYRKGPLKGTYVRKPGWNGNLKGLSLFCAFSIAFDRTSGFVTSALRDRPPPLSCNALGVEAEQTKEVKLNPPLGERVGRQPRKSKLASTAFALWCTEVCIHI